MTPVRTAIAVMVSASLAACAGPDRRGSTVGDDAIGDGAPPGAGLPGEFRTVPRVPRSAERMPERLGSTLPQGESVEPSENRRLAAERAADFALRMVGIPYRFGGFSPSTGFDCSGLVQFSFRQADVALPRMTEQQRTASSRIPLSSLRRGDLLFFHLNGEKNSHVAIYVGNGYFVHAPSSGKQVRTERLDSPYWRSQLSEARRVVG